MQNIYDKKYDRKEYYWGKKPSAICYEILKLLPPTKPVKLIDIGCGEGRNAVFFARNGYRVTAFDSSPKGVEKTHHYASELGMPIKVFEADLNKFRLEEEFDIVFSTGVLQYIPEELRKEILENYKVFTRDNGLNVHGVFIKKAFIERAPDAEKTAHLWISGELFTYYYDWQIEFCQEEIFDDDSSGIPHKHAMNRIIARKVTGSL